MLILTPFCPTLDFERECFRTNKDIQKRTTNIPTAISPTLNKKSLVNFDPLFTAFMWLMFTHQIDFFGKPHFSP